MTENTPDKNQLSGWDLLKKHTPARIGLGRTGVSVTTRTLLEFNKAHARAKDALQADLDLDRIQNSLKALGSDVLLIHSKVNSKEEYLLRPDLGRELNPDFVSTLSNLANPKATISITITEGLSATAINKHALPYLDLLITALSKRNLKLAPICMARSGRVAIADPIGSLLKATISIVLVGERPGLSSPHSMGVYITFGPKPGRTDAERNCISNIWEEGLSYQAAVASTVYLLEEIMKKQISGVSIKDSSTLHLIDGK